MTIYYCLPTVLPATVRHCACAPALRGTSLYLALPAVLPSPNILAPACCAFFTCRHAAAVAHGGPISHHPAVYRLIATLRRVLRRRFLAVTLPPSVPRLLCLRTEGLLACTLYAAPLDSAVSLAAWMPVPILPDLVPASSLCLCAFYYRRFCLLLRALLYILFCLGDASGRLCHCL